MYIRQILTLRPMILFPGCNSTRSAHSGRLEIEIEVARTQKIASRLQSGELVVNYA